MGMAAFPKLASCVLLLILPASLFGADQPSAMLYSHGTALLNGNSIPRSSAIFSGDLVQTNADSVANINTTGSTVLVLNDSLVQYDGSSVKLEHGSISISTSKTLATRVGDVTVSPAAGVWTEFEVRDVDGSVQIAARKGDLTVSDDTGTPPCRKVSKPLDRNHRRRTNHRRGTIHKRRPTLRKRRRKKPLELFPLRGGQASIPLGQSELEEARFSLRPRGY